MIRRIVILLLLLFLAAPTAAAPPSYTSAGIKFIAKTRMIVDTKNGLANFQTGQVIYISGSLYNDGRYTVAAGGLPRHLVTNEPLVDENKGGPVTIWFGDSPGSTVFLPLVIN